MSIIITKSSSHGLTCGYWHDKINLQQSKVRICSLK